MVLIFWNYQRGGALSSIYEVLQGDTFELISRKVYATEVNANLISRANPGVFEPLVIGTSLIIPDDPNAPKNQTQQSPSNNINEVALLIDNTRFRFWDSIRITTALDTIDIVEFGAPFDANDLTFRQLFVPFSFKPLTVTVGGNVFFNGTLVTVNPVLENERKILSLGGYSLPGVLNDCTMPASSFPLEFFGFDLSDIALNVANTFGLSVDFRDDPGAPFEFISLEPGQKILPFLSGLAKERNLVMSNTRDGKLLFWRSVEVGQPVAILRQGETPLLSVVPFFTPQEYYSHITGIEFVFFGDLGSQFTVKNPRLGDVVRPFTFTIEDTFETIAKTATEAKAGRMFGNAASYLIRLSTWRDPNGQLWQPNTTIKILAPDAMIYNVFEFIIRSVEFDINRTTETATLNLVLPGSFSGEIPEFLPWDL